MLTTVNSAMTLYHKVYDAKTRLDRWERYFINKVMWQGGKGASVNKGYERANDITVYVPYDINFNLDRVPFSIGDIIVKGIIKEEIKKQSDLIVDTFNITTLIFNNYGSDSMKHIQIGAK